MPRSYSEESRQEAFLVWMLEADRQIPVTLAILRDRWANDSIPSEQTLRNWEQAENWDLLAQDYFSTHAPERYYRYLGRAMLHLDQVASWRTALFTPGHPDFAEMPIEKVHALRSTQAIAIETMVGAGMHGQKVSRQEIPPPREALDASSLATDERQQRMKARTDALPEGKKP